MKLKVLTLLLFAGSIIPGLSQNKPPVTDVNTPLHAIQPEYPVPYVPVKSEEVTEVLTRIYNYLEIASPARLIDRQTKTEVTDPLKINGYTIFDQVVFRLVSYEWGVAYGAMLLAGEITGEKKFSDYTLKRMNLIAQLSKYYKAAGVQQDNNPVRSVLDPRALDDAGSMCAAMAKTINAGGSAELRPLADNYINYIMKKQLRLSDGALARNRPMPNTLWLDDLYMSVPALAQMGKLTGDFKYYDEAVNQILLFSQRMFNKENGLYIHGWVQDMKVHPEFYWARCNGWALLAMTELLDVLPQNHSFRNTVLDQYRAHIKGLAYFQSGTGFWHQLINRNESYYETSATAIFTYCIAHGINKGWINAATYGPMAVAGWNAVQTKVNAKGEVEGTCVGTGMAFDPVFYYNRPVNVAAAHGYGPVIMAGAEMINLTKSWQIVINDSAIMFYPLGTDWKSYR